jgi:predicted aldo/keto reductase-like oxidoreductase
MPCDKGVLVPGVLGFRSSSRRLMPAAVIAMTDAAMSSAENCEECGECVEKCPYNLPIPDLLKENLSLYKDFLKQQR